MSNPQLVHVKTGFSLKILTLVFALLPCVFGGQAYAQLSSDPPTPTTITLTWTAPGDDGNTGQAMQYDLRYSTSLITEQNWAAATVVTGLPAPQPAGSEESFTVTGLQPGTVYYFAIKAADEVPNWSALSNVISQSTAPENLPPAIIADLVLSDPTPGSLTLTWTAPGDDGMSGTASEYDVRYALSLITEANWNAASRVADVPAPQGAGSSETLILTGLDPSTNYYFAIKTADEVPNWSSLSNVPNATTANEVTAPSLIADLTLSNPTESTLTLTWTAPGDDGTVGTAALYEIRYSTSVINQGNWASATPVSGVPAPQPAGTAESIVVSGLQPSTVYYFAIKTADEVPNWSGLSNVASAQTAGDQIPPAAINDLQAMSGTEDGEINLVWTAPGDDGAVGKVLGYEIRCSKNTITADNFGLADLCENPPTPVAGGFQQTAVLSELQPGEIYYVAVRSYDDFFNPSPISNVDTAIAYYRFALGIDDPDNNLPNAFDLSQNFPNPFNPSTEISYSVPRTSHVTLSVYNIQGQLTTTLVDATQPAGNYSIAWTGDDTSGRKVASGVYFYRMQADGFSDSRKMVLLK
ncbi:MAG: fibronectin type III domain-containing protein [candidate division Zixibacteria bacterium]|nr:fibronectin type III domain-containing protein [candidate division Zixibacteria bacterium]